MSFGLAELLTCTGRSLQLDVEGQATLQPMKTKPRKIWEDCLLLCSWLTLSRPNPEVRKTPFFKFCVACHVDLNPSILFFVGLACNCDSFALLSVFLVTDGVSHKPRGKEKRKGREVVNQGCRGKRLVL